MRTGLLLMVGALLMLAGCGVAASPTPAFSRAAECDRNGGYWHPALDVCETNR